MRRSGALAVVAVALLPAAAWPEAACAPSRLDLRFGEGRESFAVEVADDPLGKGALDGGGQRRE